MLDQIFAWSVSIGVALLVSGMTISLYAFAYCVGKGLYLLKEKAVHNFKEAQRLESEIPVKKPAKSSS